MCWHSLCRSLVEDQCRPLHVLRALLDKFLIVSDGANACIIVFLPFASTVLIEPLGHISKVAYIMSSLEHYYALQAIRHSEEIF
jgi:hypothetical protein